MTPPNQTSVPMNAVTHPSNVVFNSLFRGTRPRQYHFEVPNANARPSTATAVAGPVDPARSPADPPRALFHVESALTPWPVPWNGDSVRKKRCLRPL